MMTEWYDWPFNSHHVLCQTCNTGLAEVACPDCGVELCPDCAEVHNHVDEEEGEV